jgi:hypothetical protein
MGAASERVRSARRSAASSTWSHVPLALVAVSSCALTWPSGLAETSTESWRPLRTFASGTSSALTTATRSRWSSTTRSCGSGGSRRRRRPITVPFRGSEHRHLPPAPRPGVKGCARLPNALRAVGRLIHAVRSAGCANRILIRVNGQVKVPGGGHQKSPPLGCDQTVFGPGRPPFDRASFMRNDSPSVTTTTAWCSSRSRRLTAVVCSGRNRPQSSNGQCEPMPRDRRS